MFVFAHYPLYLSATEERDFYDNIDEPGRSDFIELLGRYEVEGYYAGHVHKFFYNNLNGMHHFVLPSTGIIRTDYMEFFRTPPTRQMGISIQQNSDSSGSTFMRQATCLT